ncbi:MAG: hypothetical protein ACOH12_00390 [Parvibaculaceae bacterium]
MSVLSGPTNEMNDSISFGDERDETQNSASFVLLYWTAIFLSVGITVLGFWKLAELFA